MLEGSFAIHTTGLFCVSFNGVGINGIGVIIVIVIKDA